MKQIITVIIASIAMLVGGRELRQLVVTTDPIMHCESCEQKIKGNLRFEKGVKQIETDREKQHVTVTYDPSKTNTATLVKAFDKIGYKVQVVSDKPVKMKKK